MRLLLHTIPSSNILVLKAKREEIWGTHKYIYIYIYIYIKCTLKVIHQVNEDQ